MSYTKQEEHGAVQPTEKKQILMETARYLGYGRSTPDPQAAGLIRWAVKEVQRAAVPALVIRETELCLGENGDIQIGTERFTSRDLARNLRDCSQVILFAATLGAPADRLIQKYSRLDMAKAVALQAAAAAVLEEYCDRKNRSLKEEKAVSGWYLRPRFSPGYGDFPISFQKPLLSMLAAEKRIGLTATESYMLVPVKSVTAVIGMGRTDAECTMDGCEACSKTDCAYRRN